MGCFLACFGSSKHSKRTKHRRKVLPSHQQNASGKTDQPSVSSVSPASQVQDNPEEQLSVVTRKKVTFNSNVKTYEHVFPDEVADLPPPKQKEEEEEEEVGKEEALAAKSSQSKSSSGDSSLTSTGSYPPNHRYQNCRDSDDEDEEIDYGASDLSDEDAEEDDHCDVGGDEYNEVVVEEVESPIPTCDDDRDVKSIGSNPNARDRSVYVHPVLNPVENLTQWKVVKSKRTPPLRNQKENYVSNHHESRNVFGAEPSFKELSFSLKSETDPSSNKLNQDVAVDASLSNWLVSSETRPVDKACSVALYAGTPAGRSTSQGSSNSVTTHEDRPILGALTVEELKQFSASLSPRKSPSKSPDETPIIGTVGTYWNFTGSAEDPGSASSFKGIPNTTSKYREDKRVNWHSTPFETRLERALDRSAAEAASSYVPRVF